MKLSKSLPAVGVLAVMCAAALSGCGLNKTSVTPNTGSYAIVVGGGAHSNQNVHDIVDPGQHIKVPDGDDEYYLPAQDRDYVVEPLTNDQNLVPDMTDPQPGYTRAGTGPNPLRATEVQTFGYIGFVLNPNHAVLQRFFEKRCTKYGWQTDTDSSPNCAATSPSTFAGGPRSSTPGWLALLDAAYPTAIAAADQYADSQFGPGVWHEGTVKDKYSAAVAKALPAQLRKILGSGSDNYFCGYGSSATFCAPFVVTTTDITPTDVSVINAYNQANTAAYNAQAAAERASVAKSLYGPDAQFFTGAMDLAKSCPNCTFYLGNPPVAPGSGK